MSYERHCSSHRIQVGAGRVSVGKGSILWSAEWNFGTKEKVIPHLPDPIPTAM